MRDLSLRQAPLPRAAGGHPAGCPRLRRAAAALAALAALVTILVGALIGFVFSGIYPHIDTLSGALK